MTIRDMTAEIERERELIDARIRAEESNRHKSEFVARMSHEMRTPLNGVLGVAALLQNGDLEERQRELVNVISASGKVLLRLIDDILDLSKLDAETFKMVEDDFSSHDLMIECAATIRPGGWVRASVVSGVPASRVRERVGPARSQIPTVPSSSALARNEPSGA